MPETEGTLPCVVYTPLYVTPLLLPGCPSPPTTTTAMYTVTVAPTCSLEIGAPVHLHFLYAAGRGLPMQSPSELVIVPLAIRGRIAGERARTETEVEFVVKNEEPGAAVKRAFIRFRFHPGTFPIPSLDALVSRRFPNQTPARSGDRRAVASRRSRAIGRSGTLDERTAEGEGSWGRSLEWKEAAPIMDLRFAKDLSEDRMAAFRPYSMWESYGATATTGPTQAESDAIRNYGCPIVVRPRPPYDNASLAFMDDRRYADGLDPQTRRIPERGPDGQTGERY